MTPTRRHSVIHNHTYHLKLIYVTWNRHPSPKLLSALVRAAPAQQTTLPYPVALISDLSPNHKPGLQSAKTKSRPRQPGSKMNFPLSNLSPTEKNSRRICAGHSHLVSNHSTQIHQTAKNHNDQKFHTALSARSRSLQEQQSNTEPDRPLNLFATPV